MIENGTARSMFEAAATEATGTIDGKAGEDAVRFLERLDAKAKLTRTPSATGAIAWRSWGTKAPEVPPLVLLHGGSGSWRHWARNISRLAIDRRVLVPDLPGMGDSDAPGQGTGRPELARVLLGAVFTLVGDTPFHLAGFSFGGAIAGIMAGLASERIRSLTLVGPGGFGPAAAPPHATPRGLSGAARVHAHRANLSSLMIADPAYLDALALEIQEQNTQRIRAKYRADLGQPVLPGALNGFAGPINAVWGQHDQFAGHTLPARIAALRAVRPDADIRIIPAAGHWVMYEAAEAFEAYLATRLSQAD